MGHQSFSAATLMCTPCAKLPVLSAAHDKKQASPLFDMRCAGDTTEQCTRLGCAFAVSVSREIPPGNHSAPGMIALDRWFEEVCRSALPGSAAKRAGVKSGKLHQRASRFRLEGGEGREDSCLEQMPKLSRQHSPRHPQVFAD